MLNSSSDRQAKHQGVDSLTCNLFSPEGLVQFKFCTNQEYCFIITVDFRGSDFFRRCSPLKLFFSDAIVKSHLHAREETLALSRLFLS